MTEERGVSRRTGEGRRKLDKFAYYGKGIGMFIGALAFAATQAYDLFYDTKKQKQLAELVEQTRAQELQHLQEQLRQAREQLEKKK